MDANTMLAAINKACAIIETADERNLPNDGPAGGFPPQMSLAEWRKLYVTLNKARLTTPTEARTDA